MIKITLRNAETLSYLQGLGPVGEWVLPRHRLMAADLGVSHTQLCHHIEALIKEGFIERHICERRIREYRVLKRLESRDVVEVRSHLLSAERRLERRI